MQWQEYFHAVKDEVRSMLLNDLSSCFKCNLYISQILQQNEINEQWKEIFARFHCKKVAIIITMQGVI